MVVAPSEYVAKTSCLRNAVILGSGELLPTVHGTRYGFESFYCSIIEFLICCCATYILISAKLRLFKVAPEYQRNIFVLMISAEHVVGRHCHEAL